MAAVLVSQGKKRCGNGKEIAKKNQILTSYLSSYIHVINVVFFIEAVEEPLVYWDGLLSRLIWRYTFPILVYF